MNRFLRASAAVLVAAPSSVFAQSIAIRPVAPVAPALAPTAPVSAYSIPLTAPTAALPLLPTMNQPLKTLPLSVVPVAASVRASAASEIPVVGAKPALAALVEGLAASPAESARVLNSHFDASATRPCVSACAGDEVPSSAVPAPNPSLPAAGRLPRTVKPSRYGLTLSLDPEAGSFRGRVKIAARVAARTDRIVLHALDLKATEVRVAGRPVDLSRVVVDAKAETMTILLAAPLSKGSVEIEIAYEGRMNELMRGLYKSRGEHAGKPEVWSFTHLEPTHARRVLPSFDEPDFKASFRLTLDLPEALTPISNMPIASETRANGRKTVTFQRTPKMSSYLLAIYAARLTSKTRLVGGTQVTVWAAPGQIAQADFALDAAEKALTYLNDYFGLPYMLPKLDLVAAPDFASGAMENWGAILFRDSSLLVDKKLSSDAAKRRVAEVVSHEIVHQWFGNLVTMGWWNDLWLNEAFATWLAYKAVDAWKPSWKVWDEFDQGKRSPLAIDALPGTRPVSSQASTPAEIQAMFDPMTYQKGGALLRMIEDYLGEDDFRKGLRAYMSRHQYKNAGSGALWRELEKASGKPVKRMAEGWLRQPGVPVISVSATGADDRTLVIRQSRFSVFGLKDASIWTVPMTIAYRLKGDRKARTLRVLLDSPEKKLVLPGRGELLWAYPNASEAGYYRFELDDRLLADAVERRRELSPAERAGLLNNLWALTRAGRLPVGRFLEALAPFKDDRSRAVLEESAGYLKTLRQELATTEEGRKVLGDFAAAFFKPAMKRLGWEKKKSETPEASLTRPSVLAALALHARSDAFDAQVDKRLKAYLEDPASLDASVASTVLLAAARRGDAVLFAAFRERLAAPKTPEQKDLMLRALAEFSAPAQLETYLGMTLNDEIRAQDAWKPFVWLLAAPQTQDLAWEFVKANWPALVAKVGPRGATRIVGATGALNGEGRRAEVDAFFRAPANEVEMARKTLDQTLESIELAGRFRAAQAGPFGEWTRLRSAPPRLFSVGIKAFDRLAEKWMLTAAERAAVLGVDEREYARLQKDPFRAGVSELERVSLALGAYRRLGELLPADRAAEWLRSPNKGLDGETALALMTRDAAGLRRVRDYLYSVGGGWF